VLISFLALQGFQFHFNLTGNSINIAVLQYWLALSVKVNCPIEYQEVLKFKQYNHNVLQTIYFMITAISAAKAMCSSFKEAVPYKQKLHENCHLKCF
jgi:hypothetical protein